MWKIVDGNLLDADAEALVNTVNTVGVMGKGIALQFKKAFPEMFVEYANVCKEGKLDVGQMHVFDRGVMFNPRYIVNFPTKKHWKGKSRLIDIESGLDALVEEIKVRGIRSIAIAPLGCGNGGLDWNDVRPLIERAMERVPDVLATIHAPNGSPAPSEMANRSKRPEMTAPRANMLRILGEYGVLGYELTLLEIQKILYFLQAAGEPLRLIFEKGRYGPYADNLRHVLHRLEGHFIEGFGDGRNNPETQIRLVDEALKEAIRVSEEASTPEQKERVRRVFDLIEGFESPYGMELLASVHWVVVRENVPNDHESVVNAVHSWNDRKRSVMKPAHVEVARKRLEQQGWLNTP